MVFGRVFLYTAVMIDVIIPTFNRVPSLTKVIDSYMTQPELGLLIIVDDWSTDATKSWTEDLAQKYPGKVLYVKPETKLTMPELRNIGVSKCSHEYIFMGEDDVLLPEHHFKILLEKMNELGADVVAGRRLDLYEKETLEAATKRSNEDTRPMFIRIPFEAYFDRFVDRAKRVHHLHSNVLMKRKIFNAVHYDPQFGEKGFVFREETDFFLRVEAAGFSIWIIPDTLSYHLKKMLVNKTGGSRRPRLVFEYLVWRNTIRLFLKDRTIFKKEFGVKNIYWFALRCLIARYFYAFGRRASRMVHSSKYEQA